MSILINGMEMPTTCCNCDFMAFNPEILWEDAMGKQRGAYVCKRTGELIDNTKREDHCPLVELPPHGDLIDRNALIRDNGIKEIPEYYEVVRDAPTIIPAEEA